MASVKIESLAALKQFTEKLLPVLKKNDWPTLFLSGDLGAGKTTFVSAIVGCLDKEGVCEIGSPSFNLCNVYFCEPRIMHWDLYRCKAYVSDELQEALEDAKIWNIVEWAEFFPASLRPADYLDIKLELNKNTRLVNVNGTGKSGRKCANEIECVMHKFFGNAG